ACQQRSIAIFGGMFAAAGIDAPAVANDQHDRPTHCAQSADGPLVIQVLSCSCGIDNAAEDYSHRAMKWRNQILALICLLAFAALGVLYFQNWVVQKPFGIILFVGEGLTAQRTAATRVYIGGADNRLAMDALGFSARLRNQSADFAVPDAAAAASALATGTK